jgi:hypothetical protein
MARDETTHDNGEQAATREVEGVLRIGMDWNGVGDEVSAPAALTARIEPGDFDDDGRRVIRVRGTMFLHGHDVKIKRRTGTDSYMIADAEALPEEYRKRAQESDAPIPLAWVPADTDVETELREQVLDAHHTANEAIVDELGATIEVTNKGESGEGEGHSIYATGAVETDDGRSLGMKWRNAADVGHQVFTENDDLEAFDAAEIDALVQFANEESPITHRMRV